MAAPVPVGALQAIEAMPANSEAQDYAYDLYRAFGRQPHESQAC